MLEVEGQRSGRRELLHLLLTFVKRFRLRCLVVKLLLLTFSQVLVGLFLGALGEMWCDTPTHQWDPFIIRPG